MVLLRTTARRLGPLIAGPEGTELIEVLHRRGHAGPGRSRRPTSALLEDRGIVQVPAAMEPGPSGPAAGSGRSLDWWSPGILRPKVSGRSHGGAPVRGRTGCSTLCRSGLAGGPGPSLVGRAGVGVHRAGVDGRRMLDYVIKGGTVVDGTGAPARQTDVGVRGDRIVAIGEIDEPARETIDATGLVVTPGSSTHTPTTTPSCSGIPYATPSTLARRDDGHRRQLRVHPRPARADDADYTRRMMAKVEGMPLAALETGVDWKWRTFDEYLDAARRPHRRQRRVPGRALRPAPLRAGRRGGDPGVDPRGGRRPGAPAQRVAGCRWAGPVDQPVLDPQRRGQQPGPQPGRLRGGAADPVRRRLGARGHDPRGHRRGLPQGIRRRRNRAPGSPR